MGRGFRAVGAIGVAGVLLAVVTGCSPDIQSGGHDVTDPDGPLQAALSKVKQDNHDGIQNNSVTVSSSTGCFYQRPAQKSSDVTDQVACGPIRRIGRSDQQVWDTYRLAFEPVADDQVSATVGDRTAQAVPVNTSLLVSPEGTEPSPTSDVAAPQVPQTSVTDRAVAADESDLDQLDFTDLDPAQELITPTATVRVTASAVPKYVPPQLVAGQDDPAGRAPYYRPAEGQKLSAYRVKITDPAEAQLPTPDEPAAGWPDLSTKLTLVTGGQRLPIAADADLPDPTSPDPMSPDPMSPDPTSPEPTSPDSKPAGSPSALTIACNGGADGYPCHQDSDEFVIVVTAPQGGDLSLEATAGGHRQSIDLSSGQRASTVSAAEYGRDDLTASTDAKATVSPYTAKVTVAAPPVPDSQDSGADSKGSTSAGADSKGADGDESQAAGDDSTAGTGGAETATKSRTASWSMHVGSTAWSAYDPNRGWAPAGKAWLTVDTDDYVKHDPDRAFTDKRASSISLVADGTTYRPQGVTDADFADGAPLAGRSDVGWVFQVPDDLTSARLDLRPTGTVNADNTTADFTVDKPAGVQLTLPD